MNEYSNKLVTKSVGHVLFKYDEETRLFLDHVEEKWRPNIFSSRTNKPQYNKVRDWSQTKLADYVEALFVAKKAIVSGDLQTFKEDPKYPKRFVNEIQKIIDKSLSLPETELIEKAKAFLEPTPNSKQIELDSDKYKGMSKFEKEFHRLADSLDVPNREEFIQVKARLPIGLTDRDIMEALVAYKDKHDCKHIKLDVDFAKAIISTISITYTQYKLAIRRGTWHSKYREKAGFVQCSWELLRSTSTNSYKYYAAALEEAGIIECDHIYMNWADNKKAFSYKINEKYFSLPGTSRKHRIDYYKNYHIKYTMLKFKVDYRAKKRKQLEQLHLDMMDDAETIIGKIDTKEMVQACEENPMKFYDVRSEQELISKMSKPETMTAVHLAEVIDGIKENGIYVNPCDKFGGRFHTPFTNLKSAIRGHIKYDGARYCNVDIRNSQMVILATIMDHPELAKTLLSEFKLGLSSDLARKIDAVELIKNLEDVKDFCERTRNGEIYEYISEFLDIDRQTAKINLLSILFSNKDQFKQIKYHVGKKYPSLVELSNKLNDVDGIHYLPMLCQRFESALFINTIVREFFKHKKYPAVTIHDSIMVHPDDYDTFMSVYNNEFEKLGITPFQTSVERY
jgi:hypothetical protein